MTFTLRAAAIATATASAFARPAARPFASAAALAITALVASCALRDKAPPPVKAEIHAPASRAVTVTDADAGAPIALVERQELVVRLATAVVDGLEWSLVELQPAGVLAASARGFERVPRGVAIESSGDSVWHFKPMAAGTTALRFELRRPRDVAPATQVVTYVVTVRAVPPAVPVAALTSMTRTMPTDPRNPRTAGPE